MKIDGSRLPVARGDPAGRQLAATYAPQIIFADDEPFLPLVVGYTIFHDEAESPSFPRQIERAGLPAWATAIEYAIWWDWDIGHLYELEHVWSYVDPAGELVWAEGSWHGWQNAMVLEDGTFPHTGTHPLVYSQPGKHAFAPTPDWYTLILEDAVSEAGPKAGKDGVLVKAVYREQIQKTPEDDARVAAYLKQLAFTPSFRFTRPFTITPQMLVPWPVLNAWIPARVNWWLERLRRGER